MVSKYIINSRGERYSTFERSRLWISTPSELWLAGEDECRLLSSAAPALATFVTAQFSPLADHDRVAVQIRAVFRANALGAEVQLLNLSQVKNPYADEAFAIFNKERARPLAADGTTRRCASCLVHFELPRDFPKFLLKIVYW